MNSPYNSLPPNYLPIQSGIIQTNNTIYKAHNGIYQGGAVGSSVATKGCYKKKPDKQRALFSELPTEEFNEYYRRCNIDEIAKVFENAKPIWNGMPRPVYMKLLEFFRWKNIGGIGFLFLNCGIVYMRPQIIGRRSKQARLTPAGLALVDFLASKNEKFALFAKAFDSRKVRKDIFSDCGSFILGVIPASYEEAKEKHRKGLEKLGAQMIGTNTVNIWNNSPNMGMTGTMTSARYPYSTSTAILGI